MSHRRVRLMDAENFGAALLQGASAGEADQLIGARTATGTGTALIAPAAGTAAGPGACRCPAQPFLEGLTFRDPTAARPVGGPAALAYSLIRAGEADSWAPIATGVDLAGR